MSLTARISSAHLEVDAPATQEFKREMLSAAGIGPIGEVTFVSLDLRGEPVVDRLVAAGFSTATPAFLSWLGVSFYLDAGSIAVALAVPWSRRAWSS